MLHPNSDSSKYEISQGLLSSTLVIYTPDSDQQYIAEPCQEVYWVLLCTSSKNDSE